ncbi:transglutaminase-like cysteine peptidase [Cochlodiniinecator piscidefendens]|uniref:transglutaminase-like cysteine peptidase n=1 Tax=Cochlodiniinecator piscidefendens TaxID=2715756 RepID=UPI00140BC8E4|nr:transglutaminase-like cysteine peptidase [Cochlodiniinecator piscidefendens]
MIPANEIEHLEDIKARFTYKTDQAQYGIKERWKIIRHETGPIVGDCEDFALALLWRLSNRSGFKFWWYILTLRA